MSGQLVVQAFFTALIITSPFTVFILYKAARYGLAKLDVWFTLVEESTAKIVEHNDKFSSIQFVLEGHDLRGNIFPDEPNKLTDEELHEDNRRMLRSDERNETDDELRARLNPQNPSAVTPEDLARVHRLKVKMEHVEARIEDDDDIRKRINPHPYDIIKIPTDAGAAFKPTSAINQNQKGIFNLFDEGGLRHIGMFPFYRVKRMKMRWTSREPIPNPGGDSQIKYRFITKSERITALLLRDDVYFFQRNNVESNEGIPVRILVAVTARIVNPWKAVYGSQYWLEALEAQLDSEIVQSIGNFKYKQLFEEKESFNEKLLEALYKIIARQRAEYGIEIKLIQCDFNPDGPDAQKYRRLTTLDYEAEQKGKYRERLAKAEQARVQAQITPLQQWKHEEGRLNPEVAVKWSSIRNSPLTTYVDNDGGVSKTSLALPLPPQLPPKPTNTPPTPTSGSTQNTGDITLPPDVLQNAPSADPPTQNQSNRGRGRRNRRQRR